MLCSWEAPSAAPGQAPGHCCCFRGVLNFPPCKFISKMDREARKMFYLTGEFSERFCAINRLWVQTVIWFFFPGFIFGVFTLKYWRILLNPREWKNKPNLLLQQKGANQLGQLCPDQLSCLGWGKVYTQPVPAFFLFFRRFGLAQTGKVKVLGAENEKPAHLRGDEYRLEESSWEGDSGSVEFPALQEMGEVPTTSKSVVLFLRND